MINKEGCNVRKISKILISSILVCVVSASIFAGSTPATTDHLNTDAYKMALKPYEGISSHRAAMGSAGLGVTGFYDSFLYNPANISQDGFKLLLPTLHLTINNVQRLVSPTDSSGNAKDGIIELVKQYQQATTDDEKNQATGALANLFLDSLNYGYGEVLSTNVRTGLKFRNLAINLDVQDKLLSYNPGADMTTTSVIDQADISASVTIGGTIPIVEDKLSIDLGASVAFNYRAYSSVIDSDAILGLVSDMQSGNDVSTTLMTKIPLAAGYAIPVTVGANLNMPIGFTLSAVGRNFNGNYDYVVYNNVNSFLKYDSILKGITGNQNYDSAVEPVEASKYSQNSDWALDLGLTWQPEFMSFIKPVIAFDVKNCYGLISDAIAGEKPSSELTSDLLSSLNVGAQITLLNFLDVRAGLSQGYKSVGVGLDIPVLLHMDVAYYWREYGEILGQSPSDALSIRFSVLSGR